MTSAKGLRAKVSWWGGSLGALFGQGDRPESGRKLSLSPFPSQSQLLGEVSKMQPLQG